MAEYIEKQSLQDRLQKKKPGPANRRYIEGWNDAVMRFKSMVHGEKAADVAPVRHARWISVAGKRDRICSRCLHNEPYKNADDDAEVFEFCSHCGAKMDGGADNG